MLTQGLPAPAAYHRRPVRIVNSAISILNRLGLAKAELSEHSLLLEAKNATGLCDFGNDWGVDGGDDGFRDRLSLLVKSLKEEAHLNPIGERLQRAAIVRILKHRLYAQALFKQHPEILQRDLAPPIVVMGLARSGTTRLHRLLASDDRFLHLKAWESINPVPWRGSPLPPTPQDPRIKDIDKGLKAVLYMSPQIASVHPLGTLEVEEEVGLIQHAISSQLFEVQARIPSFAEHLMSHDQDDAYRTMSKLLKLIAWQRNDPVDKPWVLKTPQHMQDLDALMRVFPSAQLIFSHRDPVKVLGSACSMTWNSMVRDTNHLDPHWVGQEWLSKMERMLKKVQRLRTDTIPPEQCFDLSYYDLSQDWQGAMRSVYDFITLDMSPAIPNMEHWIAANAQHKHGAHKYRLEDFGLDPKQVDDRFSFYRNAFNIPTE